MGRKLRITAQIDRPSGVVEERHQSQTGKAAKKLLSSDISGSFNLFSTQAFVVTRLCKRRPCATHRVVDKCQAMG